MEPDRLAVDLAIDESTCVLFDSLQRNESASGFKRYTKKLYELSKQWTACHVIIDMTSGAMT